MKKYFLSGITILNSLFLFAQIPNSDFELWDNQPVPLLWETNSHPLTLPAYNPYIVVKDTDHYSGSFSANLIGNNVFHSWAKTTFATPQHPTSLTLFYKLNFPPCVNDSGYFQQDTVSVLVEILHQSNVADTGYWQFTGGSNLLWSQLTIPVSNNNSLFDSCRITITGGKIFGGCGIVAAATEFKVDHLSLNYQPHCGNTGVVVNGVEMGCLLIDTGSTNLLLPCNLSLAALGFSVGDTVHFSFIANHTCVTSCLQGSAVDITCIDTTGTTTGVENISETGTGIFLSPVPAKNKMSLTYALNNSGITGIQIVNALGEVIKIFVRGFEISGLYKTEIELNCFAAGVYFVEVKTETERKIKMFVKE